MTKRTMAAVLVAVSVLLTAEPSTAVGPDDGVWLVLVSNSQFGTFQVFASLHQNGSTLVILNAYQDGTWDYSIGTRSGATAQGTGYDPITGATNGTYSLTFTSSTAFSGSINFRGVGFSFVGSKLF